MIFPFRNIRRSITGVCESDEDYFVESFQKLFHSIDSEFSSRQICNLSSFIKISQLDPQWEYIKDYHNGTQHPGISDSIIRKLYHSIWIFKKKYLEDLSSI